MYCKYKQQTLFFYFSMVHITNNMEFQFKRSETGTNCGAVKFIVHKCFACQCRLSMTGCVWRVLCFCYFLRSFPFVTLHLLAIQYRFYSSLPPSLSFPYFRVFSNLYFAAGTAPPWCSVVGRGKSMSQTRVFTFLFSFISALQVSSPPLSTAATTACRVKLISRIFAKQRAASLCLIFSVLIIERVLNRYIWDVSRSISKDSDPWRLRGQISSCIVIEKRGSINGKTHTGVGLILYCLALKSHKK